jgi:thioredoxin-related protein
MKSIILITCTLLITSSFLFSQSEAVNIYNSEADAKADIVAAVKQAKAENKHVLLQIGGNWCPWCVKLHGMESTDREIDSLIKADYVRVLVNIPREKDQRDYDLLASLDNPQRFGFPVLVVLNQQGERIHTQDSWFLEQDKSYDKEKLVHFLKMWNVAAAGRQD